MSRMYKEARITRNPFVGCHFNCKYCYSSFRRQAKRQKQRCEKHYTYEPHPHLEVLKKAPPRTREGEFIFLCDLGDWFWCKPEWRRPIIDWVRKYPDRDFLIQSKAPECFFEDPFPENVILGTTVETNRDELIRQISKAPPPLSRFDAMIRLQHPRKMITIEPVLDFDLDKFVEWILAVKPWRVYVGYDSHPKENRLPEPSLSKTKLLIKSLAWALDRIKVKDEEIVTEAVFGRVYCKYIRKAWWE